MNYKDILNWLKKQAEYAKFAWTIIVVVAALFGYQVSLVKNPENIKGTKAVERALDSNMPEARSSKAIDGLKKAGDGLKRVSDSVFTN